MKVQWQVRPIDVKRPRDRHVAELTLLSVVDAEAATLCC